VGGKRRRLQWRLVTWRSTNRGGRCGYSQESSCCIDSASLVSRHLTSALCSVSSWLCFVLPPIAKRGQAANRRHLSPEAACAETRRHLSQPCGLSSSFRSSLSQRQQQEGGIVWLGCLPPSHITTPSRRGGVLATMSLSASLASLETCLMQSICNGTRVYEPPTITPSSCTSPFSSQKYTSSALFPADQSVLVSEGRPCLSKVQHLPSMHACSFCLESVCVSLSLPMGVIRRNDLSVPLSLDGFLHSYVAGVV
jgi:hypothetical protein